MIETLPARWYHDPDIFRREQDAIFGTAWLAAG
ncbi:MAG: phenylpropionate dioxygenase-like ring-hydroxylating dioxygenase large terminal subunit, partial [Myxococcota bacterium]